MADDDDDDDERIRNDWTDHDDGENRLVPFNLFLHTSSRKRKFLSVLPKGISSLIIRHDSDYDGDDVYEDDDDDDHRTKRDAAERIQ